MDFALLLDILPTDYDKAKDIAVWNQVVNYKYITRLLFSLCFVYLVVHIL